MPLGQRVKVCGRRFSEDRTKSAQSKTIEPSHFVGLKPYQLDMDRHSDSWMPQGKYGEVKEMWCGFYSDHSAFVFLCEACAVENGLKW